MNENGRQYAECDPAPEVVRHYENQEKETVTSEGDQISKARDDNGVITQGSAEPKQQDTADVSESQAKRSPESFLSRKTFCVMFLLGSLALLIAAIVIPMAVILSKKSSTFSSDPPPPTTTTSPIVSVLLGTSLTMIEDPSSENGLLVYQSPDDGLQIVARSDSGIWGESLAFSLASVRRVTPLAAIIIANPKYSLWIFYVDQTSRLQCITIDPTNLSSGWDFGNVGDYKFTVPRESDLAFTASYGIDWNSTTGQIDDGISLYLCDEHNDLVECSYNIFDSKWTGSFTFRDLGCRMATTSAWNSSRYLLTPTDNDHLQIWWRNYKTDGDSWHKGSNFDSIAPNKTYCSDGTLFAYQATDGSINGSYLILVEEPSDAALSTSFMITRDSILDGTRLACHYKNKSSASVIYQAPDGRLREAFTQGDMGSISWATRDIPTG